MPQLRRNMEGWESAERKKHQSDFSIFLLKIETSESKVKETICIEKG
jgi:hypothetical protein